MIKKIPLNKIVVEDINPFLQKDQVIEKKRINGVDITFYYHHKRDCLMIKVEANSNVISHEMGGRPTFNMWCEAANSLTKYGDLND